MVDETRKSDAIDIDLASLLNILWRRRLIALGCVVLGVAAGIAYGMVVTPLYRATATVRPGITAFTPQGGGAREWQLKDVERWFANRLYRDDVAAELGVSRSEAPIITADFVMRGLQNVQGGNVVTLGVLDPSPERATRILEAAMDAFDRYAMADTLSNSIALTKRGLRIQIAERKRQQQRVQASVDSLQHEIALAVAESVQVYADVRISEADVAQVKSENQRLETHAQAFALRRAQIESRLAEIDVARDAARQRLTDHASGGDGVGLRPGVVLTETEVFRELVQTTTDLQGRLFSAISREDSLRRRIDANLQHIEKLRTETTRDVEQARIEVSRRLAALRFQRDVGVPSALRSLDVQIMEREAQFGALRPLERIGSVLASERPVRPRKTRALMILTFLGLVGGITLAYVFDYVWNHRREIFRD